jgi:hypothetical protein
MSSNSRGAEAGYELIDLRPTPSTSSPSRSISHSLPTDNEDVYGVSRLTRQVTPGRYDETSAWLISCQDRQTTGDPHGSDIGEFLIRSHLSRNDFQTFLRINGSIPKPHARVYSTDGWIELGEERPNWKLDRKVSRALETLKRDLRVRQTTCGDLSESSRAVWSWLDSAKQSGLKAQMTLPSTSPSLVQSPKYRTPPILIDHLADLRDDTHDRRTQWAARVISDWLDATVVDGDIERRQEIRELQREREATIKAFVEWWHV